MQTRNRTRGCGWMLALAVALCAVAGGVSGCASGAERVPSCRGEAVPINVPAHAGEYDRER